MITEPMLEACIRGFDEQGIQPHILRVPGAAEIPFAIQKASSQEDFAAAVALGCLVKGETDHYRAICDMLSYGLTRIMLDNNLPIVFEILMVDSYQKAEARIEKGYHAAFVATEMAKLNLSS